MNHDILTALYALASGAGAIFAVWIVVAMIRVWKSPKRIDRLEATQPRMLEALVMIIDVQVLTLHCQQGKDCNGDLEKAEERAKKMRDDMVKFLSKQSVSQKEKPR